MLPAARLMFCVLVAGNRIVVVSQFDFRGVWFCRVCLASSELFRHTSDYFGVPRACLRSVFWMAVVTRNVDDGSSVRSWRRTAFANALVSNTHDLIELMECVFFLSMQPCQSFAEAVFVSSDTADARPLLETRYTPAQTPPTPNT